MTSWLKSVTWVTWNCPPDDFRHGIVVPYRWRLWRNSDDLYSQSTLLHGHQYYVINVQFSPNMHHTIKCNHHNTHPDQDSRDGVQCPFCPLLIINWLSRYYMFNTVRAIPVLDQWSLTGYCSLLLDFRSLLSKIFNTGIHNCGNPLRPCHGLHQHSVRITLKAI